MELRVEPAGDASWQMPNRWKAVDRWWRMRLLSLLRTLRNLADMRLRRWRAQPVSGPVLAEVRSELWSMAREGEFALTAGKVHNLRRASRAFDGMLVPAGRRLSFWRQLGRATRWRGFVEGRELQAGCVVPVVGGGLCQLSNALATCAARAGFELVERHAHSVQPTGPGSTGMVDATVLWNYVDLRLRAKHAWQLEVRMEDRWLVVRIRSRAPLAIRAPAPLPSDEELRAHVPLSARSCIGCGETSCFRHRERPLAQTAEAWLLDEDRPEWRRERALRAGPTEIYRPWSPRQRRTGPGNFEHRLRWAALAGTAWRRAWARRAGRRQASIIESQRWLARAMARRLKPGHRRVVVDQPLLVHLWRLGALGGRSCTVLASALPMAELQRRLDRAMALELRDDARATLADFRIDPALAEAELEALLSAHEVLTPHADVARHLRTLGVRARRIPWSMPTRAGQPRQDSMQAPLVVFPASVIARKGFNDLLEALRGRAIRLRVLGAAGALPARAGGIVIERGNYGDDWLEKASVVVLPAYVEHRPRALLMAIAAGVPVIASTACGVDHLVGVTAVEAGDVGGLRAAIDAVLGVLA